MLERPQVEAATATPAGLPPSPFSFAVSRAVVVTLHGTLDHSAVGELTTVLRDLIDDQGNRSVVVDLRGLSHVDPSVLKLFREALGWARRHGGSFRLHGLPAVGHAPGAGRSPGDRSLAAALDLASLAGSSCLCGASPEQP